MKLIFFILLVMTSIRAFAVPLDYILNGNSQGVKVDTTTPSNSKLYPVALYSSGGIIQDPATAANQVIEIGYLTTMDLSLTSIDSKTPSLGQALMAASVPVVIASNQSNVPVTVSNFPATQPISGTVAVSNFPATQPISAASLPLPTGAATEATLAAQSAKLPATLGQKTSAASLAVTLASDQSPIPTVNSQAVNTGQFLQVTNVNGTAQTLAAPANAVGFKIQAPSTNTENCAFSIGATATITAGILMEPGRSEDFEAGSNVSVIGTSATAQTINILWKIKP